MKALIATAGFFASWMLGGWDQLIQAFMLFLVLDYGTGLAEAYINGTMSSKIGAKGIAKKVGYVVLVLIAQQADQLIGTPGGIVLRNYTLWALIANEALSVLENLGGMGVYIPPVLKNAIARFNNPEPPAAAPPVEPPKQGGSI